MPSSRLGREFTGLFFKNVTVALEFRSFALGSDGALKVKNSYSARVSGEVSDRS